MGEHILEAKIRIYLNTNKRTIDEAFDSMKEAKEYCKYVEIDGYTLAEVLGL